MQNTRWNMQDKKVFISHSSKNAKFASWLSRLLKHLGVDPDAIFYSSDFRQGVRENISSDVFQALQNTVIDIVIMSNEYKSSEYCLSEAGIVLFKNKCSDKIVITLPGILGEKRAGFINENVVIPFTQPDMPCNQRGLADISIYTNPLGSKGVF